MHEVTLAMGQLTGSEATSGRPGQQLLYVGTVRIPSSAPFPLRASSTTALRSARGAAGNRRYRPTGRKSERRGAGRG
jgi:hypothetical protein